jgi:hypothetical protein
MGVGTAGPLIEKIHEMDVAGRLETLDGFNRARLIDVALREITDLDHDVVFPEYYKTARQPPYSVMRVAITRWYAWWEAGALKEGSR